MGQKKNIRGQKIDKNHGQKPREPHNLNHDYLSFR